MKRQTRQRRVLIQVLGGAERPLSSTEIIAEARKIDAAMAERTIFRNIRELVEDGRLVRVDYAGQPPRYEFVSGTDFRPHFVCNSCQKVYPLPVELEEVTPPKVEGFRIVAQETVFYGYCPSCPTEAG